MALPVCGATPIIMKMGGEVIGCGSNACNEHKTSPGTTGKALGDIILDSRLQFMIFSIPLSKPANALLDRG